MKTLLSQTRFNNITVVLHALYDLFPISTTNYIKTFRTLTDILILLNLLFSLVFFVQNSNKHYNFVEV